MPDSFIAKQLSPERTRITTQGGAWLFNISLIGAVLVFLLWGGLILYRRTLEKNAENIQTENKQLETELRPDLLNQLIALSGRLAATREILSNHSFSSRVFEFLEQDTHPQVSFSSFQFSADSRKVDLSARAASYRVVAEQVASFEADPQIESVNFSGLQLDEKGGVTFKLTIIFKQSLLRLRTAQ